MKEALKPVIITTKHRGVWYAEVKSETDLTQRTLTNLKNCRMAIKWGTSQGLQQLADTGPTEESKIGAPSDIHVLHDVTAIFKVTPKAVEAWKEKE
jgi:hypothetical protein